MCPHPRSTCLGFCVALLAASAALAQSAYFSLTGEFSAPADQHKDLVFSVGADSPVTLRTWSWSGGTNAAGELVLDGGIDSVLTLFDSSAKAIGQNNDINDDPMISRDSLLSPAGTGTSFLPPLPAGEYRVRLSNHDNALQNGSWSIDLIDDSGAPVLHSALGSAMSSLSRLAFGASTGGTATLHLAGDSSVVASEAIHLQSGAVATLAGGMLSATHVRIDTGALLNFTAGTLGFDTLHVNGGAYLANDAALPIGPGCVITLDAGTMSAGSLLVGALGAGTLIQSGGSTIAPTLLVGTDTAGSGTYVLSGGTLQSTHAVIGDAATGKLIQFGGQSLISTLHIGNESGVGTYSLGGGHLTVGVEAVIGAGGAGTVTHGFGTITAPQVTLASGTHSSALYLMGGGFLDVSGSTVVGGGGTATFVHTAGHLTGDSLTVAAAGQGRYFFDGGTITILGTTRLGASAGAVATVFHTSGELETNDLQLASANDSIANYDFSTGTLLIHHAFTIGTAGQGTFLHSGGAMTAPLLQIGGESTGLGAYRFSGGTMTVNSVNAISGTFHQTGGTLSAGTINTNGEPSRFVFINGTLQLTNSDLEIGPAGLFGANLSLNLGRKVTVSGTTTIPFGHVLELEGGSFSTGSLLNAGTFSGTAAFVRVFNAATNTLNGHLSLSGGTLQLATGDNRLLNAGVIHFTDTSVIGEIESLADSTIHFAGTVSLAGKLLSAGTITGPGHKIFGSGDSSVTSLDTTGSTRVEPAASLTADRVREQSLSIGGNVFIRTSGTNESVSRIESLVIDGTAGDWTGTLDMADNALVIDYTTDSPIAAVRDQIKSGYASGSWTGTGITSSAASLNTSRALGFAESSDLFNTFPAEFMGQLIDETVVLIRSTLYGDADLDGTVNLTDFNRLAEGYGSTDATWSSGDFNYDGLVNLDDFNFLASHFGMSASGPNVTPQDWSSLASAIPEPATALSVAIGMVLFLRRRTT